MSEELGQDMTAWEIVILCKFFIELLIKLQINKTSKKRNEIKLFQRIAYQSEKDHVIENKDLIYSAILFWEKVVS